MTVALICQSMETAVLAITPILHSDLKFRIHRGTMPYVEFCEKNPQSALRLVYIRGTGGVTIGSNTGDLEWVETEIEAAVAYPRDFRAGPLMEQDRDALIESDLWQIDSTIGTAGYASLEDAVSGVSTTQSQSREEGTAVVFGLLRFKVEFWRAMP